MGLDQYLDTILDIWKETGRTTTCSISGSSMAPLIREGDALLVAHGDAHIHVGDVVVFRASSALYAHRLVRRMTRDGTEYFLPKGDESRTFDAPVARNEIIGKVLEVRNPDGVLDFRTRYWRCANRLLAWLSYTACPQTAENSVFWRGVHRLLALRSSVSGGTLPLRRRVSALLCAAYRRRGVPPEAIPQSKGGAE